MRFPGGLDEYYARRAGEYDQRRALADGSQYEVLKNFPSAAEVRTQLLAAGGQAVEVHELEYYWQVSYEIGSTA